MTLRLHTSGVLAVAMLELAAVSMPRPANVPSWGTLHQRMIFLAANVGHARRLRNILWWRIRQRERKPIKVMGFSASSLGANDART